MEKIELIEMMEKAVKNLLKGRKMSQKFLELNIEDEFFEDSCRYAEIQYGLGELEQFLKTLKKLV